jgi:hypothetical protein
MGTPTERKAFTFVSEVYRVISFKDTMKSSWRATIRRMGHQTGNKDVPIPKRPTLRPALLGRDAL